MKNKTIILLIGLILCGKILYPQDMKETIILANNSYKISNYENAVYYYQRVLYFGNEKEKNDSYIKIADCYFEIGKFDKSYSFYELAFNNEKSDSLKNEILFKKTMVRLNENRYNLALIELLDFNVNNDKYFSQKKELYLGITYFLLNNFEQSEKYILNYAKIIYPNRINKLESLFDENKKINKKLPQKTVVLSAIIPGLGQLYIGDYKNSANSAILNLTLLGVGIIVGYRYGIISAIVSVLPWFYRYYMGGIKNVKKNAQIKIDYKRQIIFDKLLDIIETKNY